MTAYFLGQMLLTPTAGFISDNYGRKSVLKIFGGILLVSSFLLSIVKNYTAHVILNFFSGTTLAVFVHSYVLFEELVGSDYRAFATVSYTVSEAIGQGSLTLVAFLAKDWDMIRLVNFVMMIPLLLSLFLVPESPKYHVAKSEPEKALRTYLKIAKSNKKSQAEMDLVKDIIYNKDVIEIKVAKETEIQHSEKVSFISLFTHGKAMTVVTIKLCFLWYACVLTVIGLSLNSSNMNGNIFINNLISAFAQFVACIKIAPFMSQKFGHKTTLSISYGISGLMLLSTWALEVLAVKTSLKVHWAVISALANSGRLFMCVIFAVIYPFTSNMYPTVVRGSGLSFASACARAGSMSYAILVILSGWLEEFGLVGGVYLMFGLFACGGAIVVMGLPEVKENTNLHTFSDGLKFYEGEEDDREVEEINFVTFLT